MTQTLTPEVVARAEETLRRARDLTFSPNGYAYIADLISAAREQLSQQAARSPLGEEHLECVWCAGLDAFHAPECPAPNGKKPATYKTVIITPAVSQQAAAPGVEKMREALKGAIADIQWMSGSKDFGPSGQAHAGWVKVRAHLSEYEAALSPPPVRSGGGEDDEDEEAEGCPLCGRTTYHTHQM